MAEDQQTVSILLLGDEGVGKSTFLSRLCQLDLDRPALLRDGDQPFVLELRRRTGSLRLEFSDTASPENWHCLRPDMVLLCYDIGRRASLYSLSSRWAREVQAVFAHSDTMPLVVLGLKRDVRGADGLSDAIDTPQEAYGLAQQMRTDMYLECSATTGELMAEVRRDISDRAVRTVADGGQSDGGCLLM